MTYTQMIRHKLITIHQNPFIYLIIQFWLSIVPNHYNAITRRPLSVYLFLISITLSMCIQYKLTHIQTYIHLSKRKLSRCNILPYRRNGICHNLLTHGALFTQPSVCTIQADPIRTRCRGRDGLPLVRYSESSRRESDMSLGYISYTHACYLCIRLCNLYVIWSEFVYLVFTARCTQCFRYQRIQSTVVGNVLRNGISGKSSDLFLV